MPKAGIQPAGTLLGDISSGVGETMGTGTAWGLSSPSSWHAWRDMSASKWASPKMRGPKQQG